MRKKHLDPLIKNEIPTKLADIEKKAKQAWNDKRWKQRDSLVVFGVVRHVAICHLLVPMAISTSKVMDKSGRLKLGILTRDSGGSEDYAGHMAFVQV
ncbi:hypothetical protein FOXYSP1_20528 [Fusarium oxysporum f. sp. phaseoli]